MDVVGDVIPSHGNTARCRDSAFQIQHIIRSATTDIDDQRTSILMLSIQCHLSCRDRSKYDVVYIKRNFPHTLNAILNTGPHAVHNVKVNFE